MKACFPAWCTRASASNCAGFRDLGRIMMFCLAFRFTDAQAGTSRDRPSITSHKVTWPSLFSSDAAPVRQRINWVPKLVMPVSWASQELCPGEQELSTMRFGMRAMAGSSSSRAWENRLTMIPKGSRNSNCSASKTRIFTWFSGSLPITSRILDTRILFSGSWSVVALSGSRNGPLSSTPPWAMKFTTR